MPRVLRGMEINESWNLLSPALQNNILKSVAYFWKNVSNLRLTFYSHGTFENCFSSHSEASDSIINMACNQLTQDASLCVAVEELLGNPYNLFRSWLQNLIPFFLLIHSNMTTTMKLPHPDMKFNEKKCGSIIWNHPSSQSLEKVVKRVILFLVAQIYL